MGREELGEHKGGRGRRQPYVDDFQVVRIVCGRVSVLHILPNDLGFFGIFVHNLEVKRLGIRARRATQRQGEQQ